MRRSRGTLWQALLWLCLGAARLLSGADSFFIEAEEFQFYGGWHREGGDTSSGRAHLLMSQTTLERGLDAVTRLAVDTAGQYSVWVRSRDFASDRPGVRRFTLLVDNQPLGREAGAHGGDGFAWELLGTAALTPGDHLLTLRSKPNSYARCDAIFITSQAHSPGSLSPRELAGLRHSPPRIPLGR